MINGRVSWYNETFNQGHWQHHWQLQIEEEIYRTNSLFLSKRWYIFDIFPDDIRDAIINIKIVTQLQGDINCGASSQADFILNYFLSNFLSNSPFPPSLAGKLEELKPPWQWSSLVHVALFQSISILRRFSSFGDFGIWVLHLDGLVSYEYWPATLMFNECNLSFSDLWKTLWLELIVPWILSLTGYGPWNPERYFIKQKWNLEKKINKILHFWCKLMNTALLPWKLMTPVLLCGKMRFALD